MLCDGFDAQPFFDTCVCETAPTTPNFMLSSISVILRPLLEKTVTSRELILDGNQFHSQIIDAIEAGNAKAASDLMHAHLMLSARNYEYFESIQLHGED